MKELVTTKKRAVLYCRVSTKEQVEEGNSLVTQERICSEYALSNSYEIAETYREQGESAKTADRPELQKMLAFCALKKNAVKAVIIYKLDRLSRNTDDYSKLRIALKAHGVEIKSTSEHFENTPVGRFMENTLANISQFDNDIRAERCAGGMKEAIREGRYVWKGPIGYDNIRMCGKATIGKNPQMAPLILKAFEMVAANTCSVEEVYRIMTKEGIVRNGKPLANSYFRELLCNKLYMGSIEKFGESHTGLFEPIVSEELFAQVQRVLRFRGKLNSPHKTDHPDFPLRRFIVNEHGDKLSGSWCKGRRQKYPYYRFMRAGKYNYNRDKFEASFIAFMNSYGIDQSLYEKLTRFIKEELTARQQIEELATESLKKSIVELNARQTALIQKNIDGVISDMILKQQLDSIDFELIKAHASILNTTGKDVDLNEAVVFLKQYFKCPGLVWSEAKPHTKLALQRFQFPLGCTFQNNSFETAQTRKFFKVKSAFGYANFATVDSGLEIGNKSKLTRTLQPSDEKFWKDFREDLREIYTILKADSSPPTNSFP